MQTRRAFITRLAIAVVVPITLVVGIASCASAPSDARWAGGVGGGTGSPASAPTSAAASTGAPTSSPTQGRHGDDVPSPTPGRTPSSPPTGDYLARVPRFGPRPHANPIHLPNGEKAAWLSRIPTDQPVAFLTIDDGWVKRPEALPLLRRADVPVTLFLTINAIHDNPAYFQQLRDAGAVIEAHTITHTKLVGKSYDVQRHEVCGSADQLATMFGRRPHLFRPPAGEKDATTLQAVHDCGLRAAFSWKETVDKGIVRFQAPATAVQRGDIILMHFRDRFVDDFIAALQAIKNAGLVPAQLEDYID